MKSKLFSFTGTLMLVGGGICAFCVFVSALVIMFTADIATALIMFGACAFYLLIAYGGHALLGAAAKSRPRSVPEQNSTYDHLMTGSLVALYKRTHEACYSQEYVRRLMSLGFKEHEAENLFLFELMILKYDHIAPLCSAHYLKSDIFSLEHPYLTQDDDYYIKHQIFLVSEMVKIWDEAEYYFISYNDETLRREALSEDVFNEFCRLSRYGNGALFVNYMGMVAEKTHTDIALISKYASAEQALLFAKKWEPTKNEPHPYHAHA